MMLLELNLLLIDIIMVSQSRRWLDKADIIFIRVYSIVVCLTLALHLAVVISIFDRIGASHVGLVH
jgi:hypothetical protein